MGVFWRLDSCTLLGIGFLFPLPVISFFPYAFIGRMGRDGFRFGIRADGFEWRIDIHVCLCMCGPKL